MSDSVACVMGCRGDGFMNPSGDGLPRLASVGLLCAWCFQRLRRDVVELPGLCEHLLAVGDSGMVRESPARRVQPRSKVLYSATLSEVDRLTGILARLALVIGQLRRVSVPGREAWLVTDDGVPMGIRTLEATASLVAWVEPQLEWLAGFEAVGPFRRDLARAVALARARWPQRERSRLIPGVRCERCGQETLRYHPPTVQGAAAEIVCENVACGLQLSDTAWSARVYAAARAAGFKENNW
ncbi:hypothetical protein FYZ36_03175 [Mobiluncus mulieris]|uniref:hypothetical protein n=1 Tax=Mobiluncus mulieris TaxID=2052 RepID=UPI0021E2E3DE|nr:hypothetical protein [Mobiluncus mulieris]MCU9993624.1 hypothetical protein [Mobiluncus mulieris]